ncbi:MAG: oxalate:formate antiporter, partial [Dehalococcoidia bacterium]
LFANYFGRRHLGAIRGTSQMFTGPVGAMGPLMAGFIHDFTASYIVSFQIFLGAFLLVMTIIFFARPPKRRSSA